MMRGIRSQLARWADLLFCEMGRMARDAEDAAYLLTDVNKNCPEFR